MPANKRHCPCANCEWVGLVTNRTFKAHKAELENGKRKRARHHRPAEEPEVVGAPRAGELEAAGAQLVAVSASSSRANIVAEEGKRAEAIRQFACQVAEQLGLGRVSETGVDAVLKIVRQFWHNSQDEGLPIQDFPVSSMYLVKKYATTANPVLWFARDFCPEDDFLFPEDTSVEICGVCGQATRFNSKRQPVRQAYYFDMVDEMKRIFTSSYLAREVLQTFNNVMSCNLKLDMM
jgi:hypothetical protein